MIHIFRHARRDGGVGSLERCRVLKTWVNIVTSGPRNVLGVFSRTISTNAVVDGGGGAGCKRPGC